jgi:hypothetical protein
MCGVPSVFSAYQRIPTAPVEGEYANSASLIRRLSFNRAFASLIACCAVIFSAPINYTHNSTATGFYCQQENAVDKNYFTAYHQHMTKLSFTFAEEDMSLLRQLQERLAATMGKVSYIAVIRWALRQASKSSCIDNGV